MKNFLRTFIAAWYLLGWLSHIYLAIYNPQIYNVFGTTALIPGYQTLWHLFIMPHISIFAFLLAGFEILVGIALINKGHWVKIGLVFSILFNLFLVQMGLGMETQDLWSDFLTNRLPNLFFIALQIPLLWGVYPNTILKTLQSRSQKK